MSLVSYLNRDIAFVLCQYLTIKEIFALAATCKKMRSVFLSKDLLIAASRSCFADFVCLPSQRERLEQYLREGKSFPTAIALSCNVLRSSFLVGIVDVLPALGHAAGRLRPEEKKRFCLQSGLFSCEDCSFSCQTYSLF